MATAMQTVSTLGEVKTETGITTGGEEDIKLLSLLRYRVFLNDIRAFLVSL